MQIRLAVRGQGAPEKALDVGTSFCSVIRCRETKAADYRVGRNLQRKQTPSAMP
jgi:hypothetical protein